MNKDKLTDLRDNNVENKKEDTQKNDIDINMDLLSSIGLDSVK